jgi:hypothetical protein
VCMCGTLRDKISADLRLEISFDADGFFIWRETNGSAERAPRARYKFEGEMKNSQLMMPDCCALYMYMYSECVSSLAAPEEILSAESSELLAAGVCVLWFSLFAAAVPLLSILCVRERARGCNSSRRVYILEYCVTGKFLSKKAVILHNLPGFM